MPTYVYECSSCSEVFEVDQRITEPPLKECRCGSEGTVKRLIQPPAILFKGPGFYVTDSARSSSGGASASEKPSESKAPAPEAPAPAAPSPQKD